MWEECSLSDVYSGHLTFHMILSVYTKPNLNLLHSSLLMMILIMPLILTASSTVSLWLANYEYHTPTFFFCSFFCPLSHSFPLLALQDVDSDPDIYVQCPAPGLPRSASRQSWLMGYPDWRFLNTHFHGVWRASWCPGNLPRLEHRAPDPALQGINRR